jgi:ketosteroid isomerase-like protein
MPGRLYSLLVCSVCGIACALAQSMPDPGKEINSVILAQTAAWNSGDIGGYMQEYWKSDSLLFTSGGRIQRGWKATYEKYKKSYGSKSKMGRLEFSGLEINVLSPDAAWVFGHWELHRETDHPKGVFTLVFRKFAEGWKIVHDHTSSSE